jgi:formylglycine-generating enzyme required for sulfatase activity
MSPAVQGWSGFRAVRSPWDRTNIIQKRAPAHRVAVDGFWIDRTPVTNRQFRDFVRATGHVTFAELPPDPRNYPGALPHMLYAYYGDSAFNSPS